MLSSDPGGSLNILRMDEGNKEKENYHEWDVEPLKPDDYIKPIEFKDSLRKMLSIYVPTENEFESDAQYSTQEIIKSIEEHYGVPQGEESPVRFDPQDVVDFLYELGFTCINPGGMQLIWLFKKK